MRVQPFTVVLAAVTMVAGIETLSLGAQARRGPLLVLVPLAVLLGCQLYREFRARESSGEGPSGTQVLSACGWATAVPALVASLGLVVGSAVFVIAFQRCRGGDGWLPSAVSAVALATLVWVLFRILLFQSLPSGVFGLFASG